MMADHRVFRLKKSPAGSSVAVRGGDLHEARDCLGESLLLLPVRRVRIMDLAVRCHVTSAGLDERTADVAIWLDVVAFPFHLVDLALDEDVVAGELKRFRHLAVIEVQCFAV